MVSIVDYLDHAAARHRDRPALMEDGAVVAYGALPLRVRRTAGLLRECGIESGMRVGVGLNDDRHHVVMLFALAHLGAIALPVDWRLPPADAAAQMARFGVRSLIAPTPMGGLGGFETLVVDDDWWARADEADALAESPAAMERPFLIALSSGTTGAPEGRLLTHGNVIARLDGYLSCPGFGTDATLFSAAPLSQASGRAFALYSLMLGNTLVLSHHEFYPHKMIAELNRTRAQHFFCVPIFARLLLDAARGPVPLLPHLRFFESTGAPMEKDDKLAVRDVLTPHFVEAYASASAGNITRLTASEFDAKGDSVGRPIPSVTVEVVDDSGQPRSPGDPGRIRVRGPGCALADALADDAANDKRENGVVDGWIYPGETGLFDDDGYLYLNGRVSDFILRNGVNVYPQEIEAVLQRHPAVREAAVLGFESRQHGETVGAVILVRDDVSVQALAAHCRAHLATYKMPALYEIVDSLPRTLSGKINKRELRTLLESR